MENSLMPIENMVYEIRGQKVMLDSDLASLYEIETKSLNRAVKRNIERFPDEFMFQLTKEELQEVVPNWHHIDKFKFRPTMLYVFTEHGVLMLSSVLNSTMTRIEKSFRQSGVKIWYTPSPANLWLTGYFVVQVRGGFVEVHFFY